MFWINFSLAGPAAFLAFTQTWLWIPEVMWALVLLHRKQDYISRMEPMLATPVEAFCKWVQATQPTLVLTTTKYRPATMVLSAVCICKTVAVVCKLEAVLFLRAMPCR